MFSSCNECGGKDSRLMCWPHISRNLDPPLRRISAVNQNLATKLEKDIKDCQWGSESRESFLSASSLLRKKYLELETDSRQLFWLFVINVDRFQLVRMVWRRTSLRIIKQSGETFDSFVNVPFIWNDLGYQGCQQNHQGHSHLQEAASPWTVCWYNSTNV